MKIVYNQSDYDKNVINLQNRNYSKDVKNSSDKLHVFSKDLRSFKKLIHRIISIAIYFRHIISSSVSENVKLAFDQAMAGRKIQIINLGFTPSSQQPPNAPLVLLAPRTVLQANQFNKKNAIEEELLKKLNIFAKELENHEIGLMKNGGESRIDFQLIKEGDLTTIILREDNNEILIKLNPNEKIEVLINGQSNGSDIPDSLMEDIENALILLKGDHFPNGDSIIIKINRDGVEQNSESNLLKLSKAIVSIINNFEGPEIELDVIFTNERNEMSDAIDAGGPSRDYLEILLNGLLKSKELTFVTSQSNLKAPIVKDPSQKLSEKENELYEALGTVMMLCLNNDQYIIGKFFDDSIFNVILLLTEDDIKKPFEELLPETKLKMYDAFLDEKVEGFEHLKQLKHLLNKAKFSEEEISFIKETAKAYAFDESLDSKELLNNIFAEALDPILIPTHAIARGMLKGLVDEQWEDVSAMDFMEVREKVQGIFDRKYIIDRIVLDSDISSDNSDLMDTKLKWLKSWLEEEATEEDFKKFLKYATASETFVKNGKIVVKKQTSDFSPFIKSSTCSSEIFISPEKSERLGIKDDNKENFIKALKILLKDPVSYNSI